MHMNESDIMRNKVKTVLLFRLFNSLRIDKIIIVLCSKEYSESIV